MKQYGFYFDQTRCTGCLTCIVACKDWHDVPAGPAAWRRVLTFEKGRYPDVYAAWLAVSCHHCDQPICLKACPVNAITKRAEDGIVVVNREVCLGLDKCDRCLKACPYDAPQFGDESNAKMQKCDLCLDRFPEGKKPICVEGCPMRALDAGPLDELKAQYGGELDAEGFTRNKKIGPNIIFKPRRDTANRPLVRVDICPVSARNTHIKPVANFPVA
jgi:anaerobic dimethyl sulfoxide reductase subunit B (iron-sulfur subunit)